MFCSQLVLLHEDKLLVAQLFISNCLQAVGLFELIGRCGESIAVLDEGFKHLNQATHLAKVSTGRIPCIQALRFEIIHQLVIYLHLERFGCELENSQNTIKQSPLGKWEVAT